MTVESSTTGSDAGSMTELARRIRSLSIEQWGASRAVTLVGRNDALVDTLQRLVQYAQAESPILITGETGTGKELFARALFLLSARRRKPFLSINCAQYSDGQLIASELFGHRRGSFTGAVADHRGVFEEANGGIVFLDEIGELSLNAQAMLLRTLSEGEVIPVGETRPRLVDVRTIAATSRDLKAMVTAGRFRADLYYRLRFLQLRVPPVRARGDDWEILLSHYVARRCAEVGERKHFSDRALSVLETYHWPGNVRELRGLVDMGYHGATSCTIEPADFITELDGGARTWPTTLAADGPTIVPCADAAEPWRDWDAPPPAAAPHADGVTFGHAGTPGASAAPLPGTHASDTYARVVGGHADFWTAVHLPFMERELNRAEARRIISRGLAQSGGSYKRLLKVFGLPDTDYLRFMDFLRHHQLKPER
jgi:transcriptional regulator with GAF, ATPase, and Fis domain